MATENEKPADVSGAQGLAKPPAVSSNTEVRDEDEANSVFAQAASGKPAEQTVESSKPGPEAEPERKPVEKQDDKDGDQEDLQKSAEERAKEMEAEDLKAVQDEEARRILAEREQQEAEAQSRRAAGPRQIDMDVVEKVIRTDLKDLRIPMNQNGKIVDVALEDFEKDDSGYGEVARGATKVAIAAAVKIAMRIVQPLKTKIAAMEQESVAWAESVHREQFYDQIAKTTAHADVREIANSREFWAWADKQSDGMKRLVQQGTVADIDLVLRAYKRDAGIESKPAAAGARSKADIVAERTRRRQSEVDLHSNTSRGRASQYMGGSGDDDELSEEEAQREFEKASGKKA
jgi:hypothetical protein